MGLGCLVSVVSFVVSSDRMDWADSVDSSVAFVRCCSLVSHMVQNQCSPCSGGSGVLLPVNDT